MSETENGYFIAEYTVLNCIALNAFHVLIENGLMYTEEYVVTCKTKK